MNPTERWQRVEAILDEALDLEPAARERCVAELCGDDPDLLSQVERLLEACERAEGHFERPGEGGGLARAWEEEGETDTPRDRLAPGDRVGAYRILSLLGRGGMGAVYLAERADGAFARRVALKVVKRGMDTDEILARFRREREILARLQHPNIATLLDGGVTDAGLPFFVMELVEGEPIDVWCDAQRLDVTGRLRLFLTVCEAVRYAHGALVVHRDLKPSNILVLGGEAKLLDFGIAKLLQDGDGGDATGLADRRLTPEYAAPEQIRGDPTTTATDVYALGVILYELLTGERPYRLHGSFGEIERVVGGVEPRAPSTVAVRGGESGADTAEGRAVARSITPSALRQRLRGDLDCIVLRAMGKEPDRRYGSVEALAEDIRRHLSGRPVRARPDSRIYRATRFVQRNRTAVALAGLAAVALTSGAVVAGIFALEANQERDARQLEAQRATAARDFVVELFAGLDPDRLQGSTAFTRDELIDLGTRSLGELAGQPELQASVLNTLGQVAFNLGDRARAESFFRQAYDLLSGLESEPELAASMMGIGEVLRGEREFAEAEVWLSRALELRRAVLPPDDPRVAESLAALAFALYNQSDGRYGQAEAMYEELLEAGDRLPPRFRATALEGFANLRGGQGAHAEAEVLYREAFQTRTDALGIVDPTAARMLWGLGEAQNHQGRPREAEASFRRSLEVFEAAYGPDHVDVARTHYSLGQALERQGRLDEAADHLRRAAEGSPPGHLHTAFAWHELGRVEAERNRVSDAIEAYRQALPVYAEQGPSYQATFLGVVDSVAALFERSSRPDSAAFYRQQRVARRGPGGGPD